MSLQQYLIIVIVLIPFVVGLLYFPAIKQYRYLFFFVSCGVVTEITNKILIGFSFSSTLFLGHIYVLVSFVLLCLFFRSILKGYVKPIWFKLLPVGFVVLCAAQLFFFQSIKDYPGLQFSVLAIVMFVLAMVYFHKVMIDSSVLKLRHEPLIWMNAALFLYYSSNLFYYLLFNLILDASPSYLHLINNSFFITSNALLYLLIAIGFWKAGKQQGKNRL